MRPEFLFLTVFFATSLAGAQQGLPVTYTLEPGGKITPDGLVSGLNDTTYQVLAAIRKRNRSTLKPEDVEEIRAAILQDNKIDQAEADLLRELAQANFRVIQVTKQPDETGPAKLTVYPVSGEPRTALIEFLDPPIDLDAAWNKPGHDWNALLAESRKSTKRQTRVISFLASRLGVIWSSSNQVDNHKSLRDKLKQLSTSGRAMEGDDGHADQLLYKAMSQLDAEQAGKVSNESYQWLRPGGML